MSETDDMQVTDSRGRVLKLRVIDPGQMLDLMEAAGTASDNRAWMQYALMVASVASIDGVPMPAAANKRDVRANAVMIGHDGIAAATQKLYAPAAATPEDQAQATAEEITVAKN